MDIWKIGRERKRKIEREREREGERKKERERVREKEKERERKREGVVTMIAVITFNSSLVPLVEGLCSLNP